MKYRFKATQRVWESFLRALAKPERVYPAGLENFQGESFDPRLGCHKIHSLSARYARTIYAAEIEADLRVAFYIEGDLVVTVDIGSHSVYR